MRWKHDPEQRIRPPAVADAFYPGQPVRLRQTVQALLQTNPVSLDPPPKAVIAPHAGYQYSGPIAASALGALPRTAQRIVLAGPSHHCGFDGLMLSAATGFATPLGTVPVDADAAQALTSLPQVRIGDAAHQDEHCLEVMLPFLQLLLPSFSIVPLVVGQASPEEIGAVFDRLWDGPETRLVISSDLSHYRDYDRARDLDRATARAIEKLRPEDLDPEQACGRLPICGLLWCARRRGLRVQTLDLRNSGDTAGPRHQVVGYGAFAFVETGIVETP